MKTLSFIICGALASAILWGCGSEAASGDTKSASTDVAASAAKGGAEPSPNLPTPMGANGGGSGGAGNGKTGKFGIKPGG